MTYISIFPWALPRLPSRQGRLMELPPSLLHAVACSGASDAAAAAELLRILSRREHPVWATNKGAEKKKKKKKHY